MSEPLHIGMVVEGPTDVVVLDAILSALLPDKEFVISTLRPEYSVALGDHAGGWVGVYRWCRQAAQEGSGSVSGSVVLKQHDAVIVHIDADVAGYRYTDGNITDSPRDDLPCESPCPPVEATTDALRSVISGWLGELDCPEQVVMCIPSKAMEAWVIAAVWPENGLVRRGDWECHADPSGQLSTLPLGRRFRKTRRAYSRKKEEVERNWEDVSRDLSAAGRFQNDLIAVFFDE